MWLSSIADKCEQNGWHLALERLALGAQLVGTCQQSQVDSF
ncbi:MAG: hypothetical protein ACOYJG_00285 [Prevotella sp.]|jgi:hypothetical protein